MDTNRLKALFIFVVCTTFFILPTNTFASSPKIDYVVSVATETGNIWKKYLIDPISKVWEPWFKPEIYTANNFKISKNSEPKVESKNEPAERVGEVLSFSTTPSGVSRVTKEEVLNWLRDLVLLQNTKTYSPQIQNETAAPSVKYYYSSGVTRGLADSFSRSVNEINSSIGGDVSALQSNSVFNTSVLSVDAVNTRVGIGTSTPTDTLSVNGAVYLSQISAPSNTSNRLYNTAGNLYWAGNLIGGASAGVWETDGTSVWRASGNVGVGTTSPNHKVTIFDSSTSQLSLSAGAGIAQWALRNAGGNLYLATTTVAGTATTTTSALTIIGGTGNVGIGTNTPGTPLEVVSSGTLGIRLRSAGGWGYWDINSAYNFSNSDLIFSSSGNERFRINTSGQFCIGYDGSQGCAGASGLLVNGKTGIGTSTPFARLSVESTAGAAQFVIGSSTATQFIVDKNGNVGVGTSSPTEKLHVQGNLNVSLGNRIVVNTTPGMEYADGVIQANNGAFGGFIVTSSSQVYGTQFLSPSGTIAFGNSASGSEGMGFPTTQTIGFRTANVERLRIGSTGNVGVGTTSPWGLLSVNANGLTGGAPQFVVGSSTATNFIVANNGNVGIGTSAPGFLLHVNGNAMIGATVPTYIPAAPLNLVNSAGGNMKTQLNLVNTGGGNGSGSAIDFYTYDLFSGTSPGLRLAAYDNNYSADFTILTKNPGAAGNSLIERFRVTNSGNVGIGTTTPGTKLQVTGGSVWINGDTEGSLGVGAGKGIRTFYAASQDVGKIFAYDYAAGVSKNLILQDPGGNVGIGTTTPERKLVVYDSQFITTFTGDQVGGFRISGANNTGTGYYSLLGFGANTSSKNLAQIGAKFSGTGSQIEFGTSNSYATGITNTAMVIDNIGNIGIGTTSPNTLLNILSAADSGPGTVGKGAFQISYTNTNGLSFGSYNSIPFANWIQSMDHRIGNNNTYPLVLNPIGGNVGIGTTSPQTTLHIVGGGGNPNTSGTTHSGNLRLKSSTTSLGNVLDFGNQTASPYGSWIQSTDMNNFGNNYPLLLNPNGGNVGIGTTTPGYKLDLYGVSSNSLARFVGTENRSFGVIYEPTENVMKLSYGLATLGTEYGYLSMDISGNIGIATTTPWRTLSVNGTVAVPGLVNDSTGYYACVNTTTGQLSTSTSACGASSERFKENIQDIGYGLEEVLGLRPVSFDYKSDYIPNAPKQLGFIAEEVDLLVPELVARDSAGQIQGLDYPKFTAILAKAIQELSKKMDAAIAQMQLALTWFTSDGKLKVQNDICVDDVCVTKDQFKQLLLDSAVGATQTIDNSPQIVDDSGEEESGEVEMASSTPEIIPEETEQNASTTPETGIETPSETASTTPGTE